MQVILTSRQDITAKNGQKYVKYGGIYENGDEASIFLSAEQASEFNIASGDMLSKEQLKQLFADMPVCEVEFNQRGRIQTLKA